MKYLIASCFLVISAICISLYIGHKYQLARQAETPPYALCTITAIEPDLGWNMIRVKMEIEAYNITSWGNYTLFEDGTPLKIKTGTFGPENESYALGEMINIVFEIRFDEDGGMYVNEMLDSLFYQGFYGFPDQFSCDWRNPTTLLEVGKTYKVVPGKPLLMSRSIEQDGTFHYSWFSVFAETSPQREMELHSLDEQVLLGYATSTKPESRYWLTHLAYGAEPNRVRTRFVWLDQKPSLDGVSKRMNPQYCWVEDSNIISKSIHVETSGAFSNGTQMADMTIALPEIPDDAPDDVWLRMNFSQGSDDHRLVEVPVRRRTFYGEDEYPLGTCMVWRKGQPYKDLVNGTLLPSMDGFQVAPSVGGLLVYGENIYKLDAKTGASTELWRAPATDELKTCSACNVSPDGKYLAFIYDDNVQVWT
ncbi:MAG: hypothetical protein JXR40_03745 [Pontiellaceae bacterium]|nr:hypothetical protein [Pontiellaceae bacterium]